MGNEPTQFKRSVSFAVDKNEKKNEDNMQDKKEQNLSHLHMAIRNPVQRQRCPTLIPYTKKTTIDFKINIYIYSNHTDNKLIKNFIEDFKSPFINCQIEVIEGQFSSEISNHIISNFQENYKEKNNKNVLIIPIKSISDFQKIIESEEEKNILAHFNNSLTPEQQPFFLFIEDDYSYTDFTKKSFIVKKNFVLERYYQVIRLERDFEISFNFYIKGNDKEKIQTLKNILLEKKKNLDDFNLVINENYYQNLFGEETEKLESFLENNFVDNNNKDYKISLVIINQNSDFMKELGEYEKLEREIKRVQFSYYYLNTNKLKQLLSNYSGLDERNFTVKRAIKSPKYQLLKYTTFYNNFDDILFSNQISYYPYTLNIGIWGFKKSGKSTLINSILNEKRCIESQENNNRSNVICKYNLKEIKKDPIKDYPINFIEFPGFDLKTENIMFKQREKKEKMHIILFCIKYEDSLPENLDYIKSIFDILVEFKISVFFVVTQSESPDSKEFKIFKDKLINLFDKIKDNYSKELYNSIFGETLEKRIIPIFSLKKILNDKIKNPFGLDKLFNQLSELFTPKKIEYDIFLNTDEKDREIKNLIQDNELLRIFNSKESLLNDLKIKMESTALNLFFKILIYKPDSLNNISIEKVCNIYDYIFDHFLIIFKQIIDKLDEKTKLSLYNKSNEQRVNIEELKKILENKELEDMKRGLIGTKELINSPIIKILSKKLSKLVIDKFLGIISEHFFDFFEYLIKTFNKSILALDELKQYFEGMYLEKNNFDNREKKENI